MENNRADRDAAPPAEPLHLIDGHALDNAFEFAAEHARRYVATVGQNDGWRGPGPILILYTTGRRTGRVRRNPVLYFDRCDRRYVVASKGGGDANPDWYHNLNADPCIRVRVMADLYEALAIPLTEERRAEVWPDLIAQHPIFAEYESNTSRPIPVIRLDPR